MDTQRILQEAQKIASKFSFWMVSGNIAHLYGYVCEQSEKKYELEIKFDDNFPSLPPQFIYYDNIKELLGEFQLDRLRTWIPESFVVDAIYELKDKIEEVLQGPRIANDEQLAPIKNITGENLKPHVKPDQTSKENADFQTTNDYIIPDLNAYPPDLQSDDFFYDEKEASNTPNVSSPEHGESLRSKPNFIKSEDMSFILSTELSLIQQEYACDQRDQRMSDINVYLTITLTKTFIIEIDFIKYPERPKMIFSEEIKKILGDPYQSLNLLKKLEC